MSKFKSEIIVPMIPQIKPPFVFPLPVGSIFPAFILRMSDEPIAQAGIAINSPIGNGSEQQQAIERTSPPIPRPKISPPR